MKVVLFISVMTVLFLFGCPIYEICGITCPCCGTTRAWLAFLRLDFKQAIQCNAFFWLVPMLAIGYLRLQFSMGRERRRLEIVLLTAAFILFGYNCLRWLHLVAMPLAST